MADYLGDLAKTQILEELFSVPKEQRDNVWRDKMLANVADASFECGKPQVAKGPDGFPYFILNLPEPNKEFQCYVLHHVQNDFLMKEGYGVVINLKKGAPDWVFSYGDIVNYHLNKEFYTEGPPIDLPSEEKLEAEEQVLVGQPSEQLLPAQTREVLRAFFESAGLNDVRISLMNRIRPEGTIQEIVFNVTPDQFDSPAQHQHLMQSVSWFLPKHYLYVSMHDEAMGEAFQPL